MDNSKKILIERGVEKWCKLTMRHLTHAMHSSDPDSDEIVHMESNGADHRADQTALSKYRVHVLLDHILFSALCCIARNFCNINFKYYFSAEMDAQKLQDINTDLLNIRDELASIIGTKVTLSLQKDPDSSYELEMGIDTIKSHPSTHFRCTCEVLESRGSRCFSECDLTNAEMEAIINLHESQRGYAK